MVTVGSQVRFVLPWCLFAPQLLLLLLLLLLQDFIYLREKRVSEKEHEQGERQREKPTPSEQGAWRGAPSQDPGIMTWAEGRCLTDWATQVPPEEHLWKTKSHSWADRKVQIQSAASGHRTPTPTAHPPHLLPLSLCQPWSLDSLLVLLPFPSPFSPTAVASTHKGRPLPPTSLRRLVGNSSTFCPANPNMPAKLFPRHHPQSQLDPSSFARLAPPLIHNTLPSPSPPPGPRHFSWPSFLHLQTLPLLWLFPSE